MKRLITVLFTTAMFAACGIQEPETAQEPVDSTSTDDHTVDINVDVDVTVDDKTPTDPVEDPVDDPVEPTYVPGPFRSPGSCIWDFNNAYVSGATCGEVRGLLPNMTWDDGPALANPDGDGYMGMHYEVEDGTYAFSYLGYQNCGSSSPNEAWAQYGYEDQLSAMSADDRAFIECNWWDADNQQKLTVSSPSCSLRVTVVDCDIQADGNMANFNL